MIHANDTALIAAIDGALASFAQAEEDKRQAAVIDSERRVAAINAVGQYLADQRRSRSRKKS